MLHVLRSVVNPALPLKNVLENWAKIVVALKEPPRKRKYQQEYLF